VGRCEAQSFLTLLSIDIDDEGAMKLASGLWEHRMLTQLDLNCNEIGLQGVGKRARGLAGYKARERDWQREKGAQRRWLTSVDGRTAESAMRVHRFCGRRREGSRRLLVSAQRLAQSSSKSE